MSFLDNLDAYPNPEETPGQPVQSMQAQQQARMDAVLTQVTNQPAPKQEVDLMAQARERFAKAALYEQIIEGQLFEGDDEVTLAVEEEFKAFAEERMAILLGMKQPKEDLAAQFTPDELAYVKAWIGFLKKKKVLSDSDLAEHRKAQPAATPTPRAAEVRTQATPAPVQVGQLSAPKRGRGRPPGTGKNQRAAAQQASPQVNPYVTPAAAPPQLPVGVPAIRQVVLPNGKTATVNVAPTQVKPTAAASGPGPRYVPMPSPDEMVANAAAVGDAGYRSAGPAMKQKAEALDNPNTVAISQG